MDKRINSFPLFNSPLESSLRLLFILSKIYPKSVDIQRIIYYSYLSLHTGDFSKELESLHPNIPNRSCQIVIQRKILQDGLLLLQAKELVVTKYNRSGVNFKAHQN